MIITMNLLKKSADSEITPVFDSLKNSLSITRLEVLAWYGIREKLLKEDLYFIEYDKNGYEISRGVKPNTKLNLYINTKMNKITTMAIIAIIKICTLQHIDITLFYPSKDGQYSTRQHFVTNNYV